MHSWCHAGRGGQGRRACRTIRSVCGKKARPMASFNKVILLGNLTRDPDLRSTPSGTPVATFGLAMNTPRAGQRSHERGEQDPGPERRDDGSFVDVVGFGGRGE